MLFSPSLPLALLGIVSTALSAQAAPCSTKVNKRDSAPSTTATSTASASSSSATIAFAIPSACKPSCDALPKLYSADSCTEDSCTTYCSAGGLDTYIDCSNCVLANTIPTLSKKDYRQIQANLVELMETCSIANASSSHSVNLVDWYALNATSTSSTAAGSASTSATAEGQAAVTSSAGVTGGLSSVAVVGATVALGLVLW